MYCEVFYKKDLICEINVDFIKETVSFTNYTDKWVLLPFGTLKTATIQDFMNFVEDRVMPPTRFDCKEVLEKIGLPTYDAIEILRYNHGLSVEDEIWIRFDNEEVDYNEEIKPFFDRRKIRT